MASSQSSPTTCMSIIRGKWNFIDDVKESDSKALMKNDMQNGQIIENLFPLRSPLILGVHVKLRGVQRYFSKYLYAKMMGFVSQHYSDP